MKSQYFRRSLLAASLLAAAVSSVQAGQAVLNLKDADLRVVIEQISKLTGKTFVLDPRVQGSRITILSQHMMDEQEIYDTFLTILKLNGLSAVQTGKVIKIVQEQSARQDSAPVWKDGVRYSGDEAITRVIKVEHVDATQMVPVLRGLVPQQAHFVQYPRTNVIVMHDTAANIERVVEVIRQIDKASEAEVEVIPLKHASADEVSRIIENLDKGSKAGEEPINKPSIAADVRTNSILVRAEGPARLKMRGMIALLDTPVESGGNTKVIYLKYAKADDLVKVLTGVSKQLQKDEGKKEGAAASGGGSSRSGDNYTIDAHDETNSLVISAPPDMMRSLESVVHQLDIPRAQVHVEAVIVEISDNLAKELGVQWLFGGNKDGGVQPIGFSNFSNTGPGITQIAGAAYAARGTGAQSTTQTDTSTNTTTDNGDGGKSLGALLGPLQGLGLGVGKIAGDGFMFGAFIRALGTVTDSNVLSTPSITTMDNEEAEILVGQEIPIITGSTLGGNNQNPFQQVQRKEIGIKLKIKPQINEGSAVKLKIEQEVSSIAGSTGVDVVTNKRQIKNTVLIEDGETIVLGGLIDDDVQESTSKVPILGDIPIIGNLFKSQRTAKVKRNLMVFIKPTILRDQPEKVLLSSAKYNYLRARQIEQQERGINLMPATDPPLLPEYPVPPPRQNQNKDAVPVNAPETKPAAQEPAGDASPPAAEPDAAQ